MADLYENKLAQINNPAYLRCLDSAGNSRVVDINAVKSTTHKFLFGGLAGGQPDTWFGLGSFTIDPYYPTRINLSFGNYHIPGNRQILDITFAGRGSIYVAGNGAGIVGYVLKGGVTLDLYVKLISTQIFTGWVFGHQRMDLGNTTTEPSGIVYVP